MVVVVHSRAFGLTVCSIRECGELGECYFPHSVCIVVQILSFFLDSNLLGEVLSPPRFVSDCWVCSKSFFEVVGEQGRCSQRSSPLRNTTCTRGLLMARVSRSIDMQ